MNATRDLAIFVLFVLVGIFAACGYFIYEESVKEVFAPLFRVLM
jgi:hypothetical protein